MNSGITYCASLFRVLGQDTRVNILRVLQAREMNVSEICCMVGEEQSNTSRHLSILKAADLTVSRKGDKRAVMYKIKDLTVLSLLDMAEKGAKDLQAVDGADPPWYLDVLHLLGEPNRLRIVALLRTGDLSLGYLVNRLGIEHSLICHHLANLKKLGLVDVRSEAGRSIYSLVARDYLGGLVDMAKAIMAHEAVNRQRFIGNEEA